MTARNPMNEIKQENNVNVNRIIVFLFIIYCFNYTKYRLILVEKANDWFRTQIYICISIGDKGFSNKTFEDFNIS